MSFKSAYNHFVVSLILIVCGCVAAPKKVPSELEITNNFVVCLPKGPNCRVMNVLNASKIDLQSSGKTLVVACEELIDKKIDDKYRNKCREHIFVLSKSLSQKWRDELEPINTTRISFEYGFGGCVDGLDWGYCYDEGVATIPLEWIK